MRTNLLVRSLTGTGQRNLLEPVSPYLFGRFGLNNKYQLPDGRELPLFGLRFRAKTFDFGFNPGTQIVPPYGTFATNLIVTANLLVWAIVATQNAMNGATLVSPAFLFNITHSHEGNQLQWFNKAISSGEGAGTAQGPTMLRRPQIVITGDQLQVEVQNLGNYNLQAQVVLYCGEFD